MSEKNVLTGGVEPRWSYMMHSKCARLGIPLAGNFELTTRCNFNCKMCYVHDNGNKQELSAREWLALGEAAVKEGMVFLLLTGGEPFAREDFWEIYSGLRRMGLLISINTNASLIDNAMLDKLVKEPPLRMNVTLYGASNDTYRQLCGQAAYHTVTDTILRLKQAGIQTRLNLSVTPDNAADVSAIFGFAREHELHIKASSYMFPPVRVNGGCYGDAPHRFTAEEAAAYMLQLRRERYSMEQLAKEWVDKGDDDLDCVDGQGEHIRCRAGKTAFWVTWDGRMLPCGMFPGEGHRIREHGFRAAWDMVRADTEQLRMPTACGACTYRERCTVCAASCLAETGRTDRRPEYICRMTDAYMQACKTWREERDNNEDQ